MKKNPLNLLVIAVLAIFVAFTGCKDYDDDISSLESKIGNLQQALNGIQSKIDGGAVITNVTSDGGGITITLSNGQNYKITNGEDGKNGKDGAAGADGSVITIGDNGNWFIDGEDTGMASKGADGADGEKGADGADGADGVYYVPNEDGFWHKIDPNTDPATDTATDIAWLPEGTITAVWNPDNGTVALYNVEGLDGPYILGAKVLTSLVFYPELYIKGVESLEFRPMIFNYGEAEKDFWGCEILPLVAPELPPAPCIETIGDEYMYAPGQTVRFLGSKPVPAQYHVSPSALKLEMIDKDNLEVTSHWAEFRLGGVEDDYDNPFTAEYVKLERGKIFVDYDVDYVNLAKAYDVQPLAPVAEKKTKMSCTSNFNNGVLALQVPHSKAALNMLPNGADVYVTSDYAQFHINPIDAAKIDILVPLAEEQDGLDVLPPDVKPGIYRTLPDHLGLKKAPAGSTPESYWVGDFATSDETVTNYYAAKLGANDNANHPLSYVVMQEGQTIDLVDYVRAGLSETAADKTHLCEYVSLLDGNKAPNVFDPYAYNMKWEFELLDSNDETIVYEFQGSKTDQQQFIDLKNTEMGTVEAKVYTEPAQGAAIGREPIVRVRLIYGDDCVLSEAFINIKIVKDSLEDLEIVINAEGFNVGCEPLTATLTTEEMNTQVYNVLGISKEIFKQRYVGTSSTIYTNVDDSQLVGTFSWDIDADTQLTTDKPLWTVSPCDCPEEDFDWKTEYAKVTSKVVITPLDNIGPNIVIYFYGELRAPTIDLTEEDFQQIYWDENFTYIKHNVAVPTSTSDDNPDNCTFKNNLNAAFKTHSRGQLKLGEEYVWYRYRFADTDKQIKGLKYEDGSEITVSVDPSDRTVLWASTPTYNGGVAVKVAWITDHTSTTTTGAVNTAAQDFLTYNHGSNLAKYLLNLGKDTMYAILTIDANCDPEEGSRFNCQDLTVNINGSDEFKVVFLRPISHAGPGDSKFIDGVDVGDPGSFIKLTDLKKLVDWRDRKFHEGSETNGHLWGFYGVQSVVLKLTDGTTVLVEWNGNGVRETIPTSLEITQDATNLYYKNNGTTIPANGCDLYVPVWVTYKWGVLKTEVTIPIEKTEGQ